MARAGLVIGGGISGIQAALDLADQGFKVYLVEKTPSIGGNMAMLDKTFPTLDCSACILTPKMVNAARHPNIELLTYSEVKQITGSNGDFEVTVVKKPRYVDESKCNGCGLCAEHCPVETPDPFDINLGIRKAIYLPFPQAIPRKFTIDREQCIECMLCQELCGLKAVELQQQPVEVKFRVGAVIVATGFTLGSICGREEYGYGKFSNVITSLTMERLLNAGGPTGGHIIRPSDGKICRRVAIIQCTGSRDIKNNSYCSRFCCMYAIKQAILVKEHIPDSDVTIFYMDLMAFGKGFEELYNRAANEFGVKFKRGRVSEILEDRDTDDLLVRLENVETGELEENEFDLAVLSIGAVPLSANLPLNTALKLTFDSVSASPDSVSTSVEGVYVAGAAEYPKDIPESVTQAGAAAMKASIIIARGKHGS